MKKYFLLLLVGLLLPLVTSATGVCVCQVNESLITPVNIGEMAIKGDCTFNKDYNANAQSDCYKKSKDEISCSFSDIPSLDGELYCSQWKSAWKNKMDSLTAAASAYEANWRASSSKFIPQCLLEDELSSECRDINIFLVFGINVARYAFGIVGALALLMFIYGGFTLIISRGNSEKVKKGGEIMVAAVIGLVVVFGAYLVVSYLGEVININQEINVPKV